MTQSSPARQIKPKNETPRLSKATSAEDAKGESGAIVPSDPDQANDQPGDFLTVRDDASLGKHSGAEHTEHTVTHDTQ
jgi:hypothetical protein